MFLTHSDGINYHNNFVNPKLFFSFQRKLKTLNLPSLQNVFQQ